MRLPARPKARRETTILGRCIWWDVVEDAEPLSWQLVSRRAPCTSPALRARARVFRVSRLSRGGTDVKVG